MRETAISSAARCGASVPGSASSSAGSSGVSRRPAVRCQSIEAGGLGRRPWRREGHAATEVPRLRICRRDRACESGVLREPAEPVPVLVEAEHQRRLAHLMVADAVREPPCQPQTLGVGGARCGFLEVCVEMHAPTLSVLSLRPSAPRLGQAHEGESGRAMG